MKKCYPMAPRGWVALAWAAGAVDWPGTAVQQPERTAPIDRGPRHFLILGPAAPQANPTGQKPGPSA
jgi:hypothetical protein